MCDVLDSLDGSLAIHVDEVCKLHSEITSLAGIRLKDLLLQPTPKLEMRTLAALATVDVRHHFI